MTATSVGGCTDRPDTRPEDLSAYEKIKFELADIVRFAAAKLPSIANERGPYLDFFARLAEDRFNVVVVGRFNRGKTSLMNAILGTDRLPTGIVPLTSVITSVAYGSSERVHLEFESRGLPLEIRMTELPDYLTERGNPGNRRGIREACIKLPIEILRRGFYLVDTPGLGSSIAENTRTATGFLPEADALIMVSGYDSPLSEEEVRVLQTMARTPIKVFFVLNKQDMLPAAGRREVTEFVTRELAALFGEHPPAIFSTSATDGLAAKLEGNRTRLRASGLPDLEEALTRFLIENKSVRFLLRMFDRAAALLEALTPSVETSQLRERLAKLRSDTGQQPEKLGREFDHETPSTPVFQATAQVRRCEICEQINETFFEFLCHFQHLIVTDSQERARFVAAGGLCPRHSWLYASLAAPRDICVALSPLLTSLATGFRERAETPGSSLPPSNVEPACRLCAIQNSIEAEIISRLAATAPGHAASPRKLPTLCIPHLRLVSGRLGNASVVNSLLVAHANVCVRLAEDMRRYALKHDGLRRSLTSDEERRAADDALAMVAGGRSVIR